jgi:hypothetical protein
MKLRYILTILVVAAGATFLVRAVINAREAAKESSCRGRMAQLHVALASYAFEHGHLPPAYITGPDGKPWHSWRVLMLPYFEMQELYNQYRFDEPWNGPNNRKLADKIHSPIFQCPGGPDHERTTNTNYVVVVGEGTAFPSDTGRQLADFHDGVENTILLLEIANSDIHWMEPRDLHIDSLTIGPAIAKSPSVSSRHPRGPAVLFADKIGAFRLRQPFRLETLRALLTVAGGEPISRQQLIAHDPNYGPFLSEK